MAKKKLRRRALPTVAHETFTENQPTGCKGSDACSVCGHPMRHTGSNHAGFCRCCEAKLTEQERATLSFYGGWRYQPWARTLNKKLHNYGQWCAHVRSLRHMLIAIVNVPSVAKGGS